jgi:WhiB family redox-sensing transcriptional regulator
MSTSRVTQFAKSDLPGSLDWQEQAACQGKSDIFLASSQGDGSRNPSKFDRMVVEHSKAICAVCPVIDTCLAWALAERIPYYVYGGLSWEERRRLLGQKRSRRRLILVDTPTGQVEA